MTIRIISVDIIRNARREIFIARRPTEVHIVVFFGEFPGGKVESGESPEQALYRELRKETDIDVEQTHLLATTQHHFAERQLAFLFLSGGAVARYSLWQRGAAGALVPAAGAKG